MPVCRSRHRAYVIAAFAVPILMPHAGRAEVIALADMMRGIETTQAQCAAVPNAVWVTAHKRSFCIKYYLSEAGGKGTQPIAHLSGDKLGKFKIKKQIFEGRAKDRDVDTDNLLRTAERISKLAGTPALYLARPGLDGSSGFHGIRHSVLELEVVNAALDAIKQRHGYQGFHLVGQSGGATLVGGLLGLRGDIGCAVPGGGRLALLRAPRRSDDPGMRGFDVMDSIPAIARNRAGRILVVTDGGDEKVQAEHQLPFVRELRKAGGQVDQLFVQARDENRHGVSSYARIAVAECVRGTPTPEISLKLAAAALKRAGRAKGRKDSRSETDNEP